MTKIDDAKCDVFVDPTGVKVKVNFGDSRSKYSRDVRLHHFVTNEDERRRPTDPMAIGQKRRRTLTIALSENAFAFRILLLDMLQELSLLICSCRIRITSAS